MTTPQLAILTSKADPLLYDHLVRRWQSGAERASQRQDQGFVRAWVADMNRGDARLEALEKRDGSVVVREDDDGAVNTELVTDDTSRTPDAPRTRTGDYEQWTSQMAIRFVAGRDKDFDYAAVDTDDALDDSPESLMDKDMAHLDAQEPEFLVPQDELKGETGVQDY